MQHCLVKIRSFNRIAQVATLAALAATTSSTFAHHAEWMSDSPVLQGLSMPVHGLDHLLLSLTVGFLSVKLARRRGLAIAAIHTIGLLLGALVNFAGTESAALTYGIPALAATVSVALLSNTLKSPLVLTGCGVATLLAGLLNAGAMVASVRDAGGAISGIFLGATLVACAAVTAMGSLMGTLLDVEGKARRSAVTALVLIALTAASVLSTDLNEAIIRFLEN
jgi:urease accessory protein